MRIRTAAEPLAGDGARGGEAVHARHLDVEDGEVGVELAHELDRVVAAAGLPHDLVVLLLEDLLEVEADDRLVFGEDDAYGLGHRGAPASEAVGGRTELGGHAVEERVLLGFELAHRPPQRVPLADLGVGVAAHLAGFGVGHRRLGHERAQPGVLGLGLEERALLVGDGQLRAQPLQAVAHVDQAALQQGARHRTVQSTRRRRVWQRRTMTTIVPATGPARSRR